MVSGVSLKAEATPVALRKLGDRVRDEWAKLYADNSEEEDSLQFPAPVTLKFWLINISVETMQLQVQMLK